MKNVKGSFTPLPLSVITAKDVTLRAVPAVVGTTKNGFNALDSHQQPL